jgi:hypothetical protein
VVIVEVMVKGLWLVKETAHKRMGVLGLITRGEIHVCRIRLFSRSSQIRPSKFEVRENGSSLSQAKSACTE